MAAKKPRTNYTKTKLLFQDLTGAEVREFDERELGERGLETSLHPKPNMQK
jgi:hypothetical protein